MIRYHQVNDPGHEHNTIVFGEGRGGAFTYMAAASGPGGTAESTAINKTGISVDSVPAKSGIEVAIDSNEAGEHLPLVYVLLCQTK